MRVSLKVNINSKNVEKKFPNNYRQEIFKLIKGFFDCPGENFEKDVLKKKIVNTSYIKPFTFSVYLPKAKPVNRKILFNSNFFLINLSFGNYYIYNNKNENDRSVLKGYDIFDNLKTGISNFNDNLSLDFRDFGGENYELTFNNFLHRREKIEDTSQQLFKTLSPVLICKKEVNKHRKWLLPSNPEFNTYFNLSTKSLAKKFINIDDFDLIFTPKSIKKVHIIHNNEHIIGFSGAFTINAPSPVIKLLYEIGLGAKRNEGFGMLEVVD